MGPKKALELLMTDFVIDLAWELWENYMKPKIEAAATKAATVPASPRTTHHSWEENGVPGQQMQSE